MRRFWSPLATPEHLHDGKSYDAWPRANALRRIAQRLRASGVLPIDDRVQLAADHVHRAEHVVLRQRDAHVNPADARAYLVVLLVPRALKELVHPRDQRHLEPADLRLVLEGLACAFVLENLVVEDLRAGPDHAPGQ